mgnify:CR=1 FL=1
MANAELNETNLKSCLSSVVDPVFEKPLSVSGFLKSSANIRGKQSGGRIGLNVKNIIAVGAGKGGVGKSTVAASLAYALQQFGARVGLVDADVYGPSIPHLVGTSEKPVAQEFQNKDGQAVTRIVPVEARGLKVMSMAFFVEPDQAVIWRGPMLHKAITQFLQDT